MNICLFTKTTLAHGLGGVEVHVEALSKTVPQIGHSLTIIASKHPGGVATEMRNQCQTYYLPRTKVALYSHSFWRRQSGRQDCIHFAEACERMTVNPLVSIVLPTYNGTRYLDQAVQSCLSQTYSNWELIIVDDASTDDTPVRIAHHMAKDSRIRSVRHETNRKLPAALNTGFSRANGDYLTWTSDDNCYRPQALAEMVTFLESQAEIDVVYTAYSVIDERGHVLQQLVIRDLDLLLRRNCVGPCFLYRRSVYEKTGGYAEDLFLAEDYDFWLRVSVRFRLQPLHKDLYLYRDHGDSLTVKHEERINLAAEQALARNLLQMKWASVTARGMAYLHLADKARARHDMTAALRYLLGAMRYSSPLFVLKVAPGLLVKRLLDRRCAHVLSTTYEELRRLFKPR